MLSKWAALPLIGLDCAPGESGGRRPWLPPHGLTCLNTLCCSKSPQLDVELSASRQHTDAATEQSWEMGDQKTLQSAGNGNSDKDWLPGAGWRGSKCDYKKPACSQRAASSLLHPSISRLQAGDGFSSLLQGSPGAVSVGVELLLLPGCLPASLAPGVL